MQLTEDERYAIVDKHIKVTKDGKEYEAKFNGAKEPFPVLYVFGLDLRHEYSWVAAKAIAERGTLAL